MNDIRTDYAEPRDGRGNEWENVLGRLDAGVDEINRILGRSKIMEEPQRDINRIVRTPKVI